VGLVKTEPMELLQVAKAVDLVVMQATVAPVALHVDQAIKASVVARV
jgi:hypothetical protein